MADSNQGNSSGISTVTVGPGAPAGQQTSTSDQPQGQPSGQPGGGTLAATQQAAQDPSQVRSAGGGTTGGAIGPQPGAQSAQASSSASSTKSKTEEERQKERQQLMDRGINPETMRRYDETVPGGFYLDDKGRPKDAHGNSLDPKALEERGIKVGTDESGKPKLAPLTDSERALRGVDQPIPPPAGDEPKPEDDETVTTDDGREVDARSHRAANQGPDAGQPGRPTAPSVKAAQQQQQQQSSQPKGKTTSSTPSNA